MSNEEKIFEGLEDIRSDLATVKVKIDDIEMRMAFGISEPQPTPAQQLEAIRQMHELFPFTDEENEEFGRYMEELENKRGDIA